MSNEFENIIDISEEVEELSDERKLTCLRRALKELGIDENEEFEETPELEAAFELQLKMAVLSDIFEGLQQEGLVEPHGVDEDGEMSWTLTEKGREYVERLDSTP